MRGPGLVVVLDGPAYVGRSTTLAALQRRWPEVRGGPLLDVGLDRARASFGPGMRRWHELLGPTEGRQVDGQGGPHLVFGPLGRELVAGMHRAAAAWASAGIDVALDHLLPDRTTATDLATALEGLPVLHVGLVCDPDVLEDREREEGSTTPGMAVTQLRVTQDVARRDLVLDTTEATTDELVDRILAALERHRPGWPDPGR